MQSFNSTNLDYICVLCQNNGTYISGDFCKECDSKCEVCISDNFCTICKENYFLNSENLCVNTCPDGYYPDLLQRKCEKCNEKCSICFGPNDTECSSCNIGFFQYQTACLNECPMNMTNDINNSCIGKIY